MNNERKPNNAQGNNNGGRWHKKKNRRKPYYVKDKKADESGIATPQNEEMTQDDATEKNDAPLSLVEEIENDRAASLFETGSDTGDTPVVTVEIEEEEAKIMHVAGIRFKPNGKVYYFDKGELVLKNGSNVIVDTARGLEFGEVAFGDKEVKESSLVLPLRNVVRVATEQDVAHNKENREKEDEAFKICLEKIAKHNLDMKLIEAQYSFDNSKLLFYFTSASRVDFRELVKDLASVFKTRIELRQIGIRDEAKLMGGLGACGRSLCCSTFLSDFVQVSIRMAKEQNLSLNSGKISGCCGRLMCCLQYEYSTYAEETAKTPPVDSTVKTKNGIGTVTEINALAGTVKVRLKDNPDAAPETYKREDVTVISRPNTKKDD